MMEMNDIGPVFHAYMMVSPISKREVKKRGLNA